MEIQLVKEFGFCAVQTDLVIQEVQKEIAKLSLGTVPNKFILSVQGREVELFSGFEEMGFNGRVEICSIEKTQFIFYMAERKDGKKDLWVIVQTIHNGVPYSSRSIFIDTV